MGFIGRIRYGYTDNPDLQIKMLLSFNKIIAYTRESFFPVFCLGCGKEGGRVCGSCCKTIDTKGMVGHFHLAVTPYHEDWLIGKIVRGFKYNYEEDLFGVIGKLVKEFVEKHLDYFAQIDIIVPVPLHKKRRAERGFNQSEFIAQIISKTINKPVSDLLVRHRNTEHQARLNREKRLVNVKDAFKCISGIRGRILLVDDVYTTGSTMRECTNALLGAGANKVFGFSLAKG